MIPNHRQLRLTPCPHCPTCPVREDCGESRTEYACPEQYVPLEKGGPDIMDPRRPDLGLRLADCGGLDLNAVAQRQDLPSLPPYIPCVLPRLFLQGALDYPAVAVPLNAVVSDKAFSVQRGTNLRRRLGLLPSTKLILLGFGDDKLLENIWPRRHSVIAGISALSFDLVTAFDYSLWYDDTRLEHRYNLVRSLRTYELLQQHGIPAIPHIYWFNQIDLDDWCTWLHLNQAVTMISIDLQCCDYPEDWHVMLKGLEYLESNAPTYLSYLISGVAYGEQGARIPALLSAIPRLHLTNLDPYVKAVHGYETVYTEGYVQRRKSFDPRLDIFMREVQKMQALVSRPPHARPLVRQDAMMSLTI